MSDDSDKPEKPVVWDPVRNMPVGQRPSGGENLVWTDEMKRKVCDEIRKGVSRKRACLILGVHPTGIYHAAKRDPKFKVALKAAEADGLAHAEKVVHKAAKRGIKAAQWLLERKLPEEYGRRNPTTFDPSAIRSAKRAESEKVAEMYAKLGVPMDEPNEHEGDADVNVPPVEP